MIIQSGSVAMGSVRSYHSVTVRTASYSGWGSRKMGSMGLHIQTETAATLPQAKDSVQRTGDRKKGGAGYYGFGRETALKQSKLFRLEQPKQKYRGSSRTEFDALAKLMELLFGRTEPEMMSLRSFFDGEASGFSSVQPGDRGLNDILGSLRPTQEWGMEAREDYYFEEREDTAFFSKGTVKTADGRSIDFDMSAIMSRSFSEHASVQINYAAAYKVDPLVINLDTDSAKVREQKFLFDIDADGELDNISMLSEACGFLALDKNGDGVINDGSELFGTSTGNGFEELAVFDMDGNGWIDENDEIFNHLRIWTKDENGNDKLVALGVAGVGAIYLGNVSTDFDLNEAGTNENQAQIRRTGIYLKESGEAGTIQHVDMAAG